MFKMRDFTSEESEAYNKSLKKIYKPIGINIRDLCDNISTRTRVNFYDKDGDNVSWAEEEAAEEKAISDLRRRKEELGNNLDVIEKRLDNLVEEFTSMSTDMRVQISDIRTMLDQL